MIKWIDLIIFLCIVLLVFSFISFAYQGGYEDGLKDKDCSYTATNWIMVDDKLIHIGVISGMLWYVDGEKVPDIGVWDRKPCMDIEYWYNQGNGISEKEFNETKFKEALYCLDGLEERGGEDEE